MKTLTTLSLALVSSLLAGNAGAQVDFKQLKEQKIDRKADDEQRTEALEEGETPVDEHPTEAKEPRHQDEERTESAEEGETPVDEHPTEAKEPRHQDEERTESAEEGETPVDDNPTEAGDEADRKDEHPTEQIDPGSRQKEQPTEAAKAPEDSLDDGTPQGDTGEPGDRTGLPNDDDSDAGAEAESLQIRSYSDPDTALGLEIRGGSNEEVLVLVFGAARMNLALPFGPSLTVRPDVVVPLASFQADGLYRAPLMPFDPLPTAKAGSRLWVQALAVDITGASLLPVRTSKALLVDEDHSNHVLSFKAAMRAQGGSWFLDVEMQVPSSGYSLGYESKALESNGATRACLRLTMPKKSGASLPVVETLRESFELGQDASARLAVYLQMSEQGSDSGTTFKKIGDAGTK